LFRQKDPKPFSLSRGPGGPLRGSPTPAAAQLAALKQCSPKTPESAALLGHAKGKKKFQEKRRKEERYSEPSLEEDAWLENTHLPCE